MIPGFIADYAAPVVVATAIGVAGTIGIGHSERISSLETEAVNTTFVQRELLKKSDSMLVLLTEIETKLKERERYEQRAP